MDPQRTPGSSRLSLYPEIVPYRTGRLKVSDVHELYFEECGTPSGKPVVMLHGGPGGGISPVMRRYHDPRLYRIVLFDQRGCGRSIPHASLEENTTWDLVADIERLREHLAIDRWQVFGGSWGSTLALAYAEAHPARVAELILRGIFTLRRAELEWFYQDGCSWLFPDAFADYVKAIPEAERADMIAAYYRRLTSDDQKTQTEAARAWSAWEWRTLSLLPDFDRVRQFSEDHYALAFARIESHYFINGGFFETDDQLIRDARLLADIPGAIVHGRYDVVTPVKNAFDLARAWPKADLRVVPDAGHAMTEPGIVHELIAATRIFSGN
ncbi:proline iminopeptidase [Methyloceanibacter superfactus]|uniref:Proline iminopeptidase n=1 Tax=Methyloceanibacter superfactus TaxID=1774969 RepID=A0A1E3W3R1_9HYPH|nr:prolyl aminopeptidase [Methyloceanibacter superfactus]ODS00421.1 proline iminopeptidase [Methyloceanibacter superfactus]